MEETMKPVKVTRQSLLYRQRAMRRKEGSVKVTLVNHTSEGGKRLYTTFIGRSFPRPCICTGRIRIMAECNRSWGTYQIANDIESVLGCAIIKEWLLHQSLKGV
jgi:hypothetical protein